MTVPPLHGHRPVGALYLYARARQHRCHGRWHGAARRSVPGTRIGVGVPPISIESRFSHAVTLDDPYTGGRIGRSDPWSVSSMSSSGRTLLRATLRQASCGNACIWRASRHDDYGAFRISITDALLMA